MKIFKRALLTCLLIGASAAAGAAQQQNANLYINWSVTTPQTYNSLSQDLQVTQKAPGTFWANAWYFSGQNYGGYIGLQTSYDGSGNEIAIFSIWNASSTHANCRPFAGEGTGASCSIPYSFSTTKRYRFLVSKGAATVSGQSWNGYVVDLSTNTQKLIGTIQTAANVTAFNLPQNFVEYYGEAVPTCGSVPVSTVNWYQPSVKPVSGYFSVTGKYSSYVRGACTGGSATPATVQLTPVVKVTLGGAQ
jgi:hypothetical protein